MASWFGKLRYAWRRHGPTGLLWLVAYNVAYHSRGLVHRVDRQSVLDPFDQENGTDTGGTRKIASLDVVDSPVALYAVQYEPSSAQLVRDKLAKLDIDAGQFTFIDFGSGKGRVLFIAADHPFREVIGIEFSRELHEIALRNIDRLPRHLARGARVRSVNGDAAAIELPKGNLVCYFNNPFGPPIISRVAERLVAHHRDHACDIIVVYVVPRHRDVFERSGIFTVLDETQDAVIFTTMPGQAT
jgi:SAM-dependent methyltransferase